MQQSPAALEFRCIWFEEEVMKNMTLGAFAFALALASTPVHALSFNFSFTSTATEQIDGFIPGTVTGHIDGLQDNAIGPATAVFIDSAPPFYNLTFPFLVRGVSINLSSPPRSLRGLSFQVVVTSLK